MSYLLQVAFKGPTQVAAVASLNPWDSLLQKRHRQTTQKGLALEGLPKILVQLRGSRLARRVRTVPTAGLVLDPRCVDVLPPMGRANRARHDQAT